MSALHPFVNGTLAQFVVRFVPQVLLEVRHNAVQQFVSLVVGRFGFNQLVPLFDQSSLRVHQVQVAERAEVGDCLVYGKKVRTGLLDVQHMQTWVTFARLLDLLLHRFARLIIRFGFHVFLIVCSLWISCSASLVFPDTLASLS